MKQRRVLLLALVSALSLQCAPVSLAQNAHPDEDGYELWLRYPRVEDASLLQYFRQRLGSVEVDGESATLDVVRDELQDGLSGLLGMAVAIRQDLPAGERGVVFGTPSSSFVVRTQLDSDSELRDAFEPVGEEGFVIWTVAGTSGDRILIAANTDVGVLHGAFRLLRMVQTGQRLDDLKVVSTPAIQHRILNHWDNLDGTVERGYAGASLWDWHKLPGGLERGDDPNGYNAPDDDPGYLDPRYQDYARANASIGINGTVLTNVNANALVLTPMYLRKAAALADVFRPYGIKVYLTARFSAPIEIGQLETADPADPDVRNWWKRKADEIYRYIPDFGGFLVKANSEGQPGPQDYDRSHAEGANMLADAVAPHGGLVMWRAFVYSAEEPDDRAKQAYNEFVPLDGTFRDNVLIQVKNGPIDFQPREPFHPMFGAMPETPLAMEFQITQEYLGQATHLAFLAPMYKEVLDANTHAPTETGDPVPTVAHVIDGSLHGYTHTGIAGVSNIGADRNWCGAVMACANWYAFGRLAWDPDLSSEQIADEWVRMTFTNNPSFVHPVVKMMLDSREAVVNYMTPLGLHHQMAVGHHYGPGPWVKELPRADWTSVYYNRADTVGIGFNRTATGSDAVGQYFPAIRDEYGDLQRVPENLLLWFHHVPWTYTMTSGRSLWDEMLHHYYAGAARVKEMQRTWDSLDGMIDDRRFQHVRSFLAIQEREARWWRDASVLYFQTFSRMPIPDGFDKPRHSLEYFKGLEFPYAPGN